jgi:LysM repeat protein
VKPGDSAVKIARANNLTVAQLQALNPNVEWAKLRVSETVRIKPEPAGQKN